MVTARPVAPPPAPAASAATRPRDVDDAVTAVVVVLLLVRPLADVAGPVASAAVSGLLVVSTLWWAAGRWLAGSLPRASVPDLAIVALVVAAGLSTLGSQDPVRSAGELARLVASVTMFVLVEHLCARPPRRTVVLVAVVAAAVAPLAASLLGWVLGLDVTETKDQIERLRSTFAQSNPFAHFLVVVLVVLVAAAWAGRGRLRTVAIAAMAPVVLALGQTYTRLAWGAAAAGVFVVALLAARRRGVVVLVALAVGVGAVLLPPVAGRLEQTTAERPAGPEAATSLEWRLEQWEATWRLAADNPVSGIGPGLVETRLANAQPPHNDYLRAFVELGVVGLVALVVLLVALGREVARAVRRAVTDADRVAALAGAGVLAVLVVTMVAANLLGQVVVLWYDFAVLGAAVAVARGPALSSSGSR